MGSLSKFFFDDGCSGIRDLLTDNYSKTCADYKDADGQADSKETLG